ncbi:Sodium/calcium exchanger protein-domain-containing protein [Gaertneriomyces semiglobifer]|nr:Sodium/calcium exchanger protein-domain-containing protein [Gaertneriomyces semiglobifer]
MHSSSRRHQDASLWILWMLTLLVGVLVTQTSATIADTSIVDDEVLRVWSMPGNNERNNCGNLDLQPDKCSYIRENCPESYSGIINWQKLYYCHMNGLHGIVALMVVTVYLFFMLGIAAGEFLCPNLSNLSAWMGLSESVAGVTLAALGNGSPDLFSTFSAMQSSSAGLAIGELLGAGLFVTLFVVGVVAIIKPFRLPRRPFIRDVVALVGAVSLLLFICFDKRITTLEGLLLIAYYLIYVAVVIIGSWVHKRQKALRRANIEVQVEVTPPRSPNRNSQEVLMSPYTRLSVYSSANSERRAHPNPSLFGHSLSPDYFETYDEDDTFDADFFLPHLKSVRLPPDFLHQDFKRYTRRRSGSGSSGRSVRTGRSIASTTHTARITLRNRSRSGSRAGSGDDNTDWRDFQTGLPTWDPSYQSGGEDSASPLIRAPALLSPSSLAPPSLLDIARTATPSEVDALDESTLHVCSADMETRVLESTPLTSPEVSPEAGRLMDGPRISAAPRQHCTRMPGAYEKTLHTLLPGLGSFTERPFRSKLHSIALYPLYFLFGITIPVACEEEMELHKRHQDVMRRNQSRVREGDYESGVDIIDDFMDEEEAEKEALLVPAEDGQVTSDGTFRRVDTYLTIIQSGLAPLFTYFALFARSMSLWISILCVIGGVLCASLLFHFFVRRQHQVIAHGRTIAVTGFIISVLWIYIIASEVVGVLSALANIGRINETLMGLTLFAVGNSVGDLITNTSIARLGFPTMAVGACFGGPMLNLVLGMGISSTVITWKTQAPYLIHGDLRVVYLSGALLVTVLLCSLIWVPLHEWKMGKSWGWTLVAAYITGVVGLIGFLRVGQNL